MLIGGVLIEIDGHIMFQINHYRLSPMNKRLVGSAWPVEVTVCFFRVTC